MTYVLRVALFVLLSSFINCANAQPPDLPWHLVSFKDVKMSSYPDSTAGAVVLDERGQVFIDFGLDAVIFERYLKIKILNKTGIGAGDFAIAILDAGKDHKEKLISVMAASYNLVGITIEETKLTEENIFTQKNGPIEIKKFALPNMMPGTVIEVKYKILTPGRTIKRGDFQSDLPKIHCELTTLIPDAMKYNIILKGNLVLSKQEETIIKHCYNGNFDCVRKVFGMDSVPRFKEQDFMPSRRNYVSGLQFDLASVGKGNFIRGWANVDHQLMTFGSFGRQIENAMKIWGKTPGQIPVGKADAVQNARQVFRIISDYYQWNKSISLFASKESVKAFETHSGNSADINLALIAAMRVAGLSCLPIILSTRDNGLPNTLYPDIGEFNYVVAAVIINEKVYVADATSRLLPFNMLPLRCVNVVGHIVQTEGTLELIPDDRFITQSAVSLTLGDDGTCSGTLVNRYGGYDALLMRERISEAGSLEEYLKRDEKKAEDGFDVTARHFENLDLIDSLLTERMDITIPKDANSDPKSFFFHPFLANRVRKNPFQDQKRLYPVDLITRQEKTMRLELTIPPSMTVDEFPKSISFLLPDRSAKYMQRCGWNQNTLTVVSTLVMNNPITAVEDYPALKDFFGKMVQMQEYRIVLQKIKSKK